MAGKEGSTHTMSIHAQCTRTHILYMHECEHVHAAADSSLIVLSAAVMKLEMLLSPLNRIHTGGIGQL